MERWEDEGSGVKTTGIGRHLKGMGWSRDCMVFERGWVTRRGTKK